MKRTVPIMIVMLMVFVSLMPLVHVNALDYSLDTDLGSVDGSFHGEHIWDQAGNTALVGDVNGDGYDDILIGSSGSDGGGDNRGQVYLILGKSAGWNMDVNLSNADASWIGEHDVAAIGSRVSAAGDVNGDGYDDILFGSRYDDDKDIDAGQVYLVFGKESGWSTGVSAANADASFRGERRGDGAGSSIAGGGDVNGDGYDDFLIGAYGNDEQASEAGQVYLIFGKETGWSMDTNLSTADASFHGESSDNYAGRSISCRGDINNDGFDDILIGVDENYEAHNDAGQTYVVFGKAQGWNIDTNLGNSDASFHGEEN